MTLGSLIEFITSLDIERVGDFLRSFGFLAIAVAMIITFLQACFPVIPFFVVAGANVLVFGLWPGMTITYMMTVAGAVAAFLFARNMGREWVERKLSRYKKAQKLNRNLADNGFFYVLMGRLAIIVPSFAINWIGGLSRMRVRHFVYATLLGKIPVTVLESLIGHDLIHFSEHKSRLVILVAVFIGLTIAGRLIQKKLTTP